jgi:xylan 1,4-beta-xylosidase
MTEYSAMTVRPVLRLLCALAVLAAAAVLAESTPRAGTRAALPRQAGNLLANGGFDAGTMGWQPLPPSAPSCAERAWQPAGFVRVRLTCDRRQQAVGWQQIVAVTGGQHYRLRHRVRVADVDGEAEVTLRFVDAGGQLVLLLPVEQFAGSQDWTDVAWAFAAPAAAARVAVQVGFTAGTSGTVDMDDVVLAAEPPGERRSLAVGYDQVIGRVRTFGGTNRGPLLDAVDYTDRFRATGLTMVRTHDYYGPFDMIQLFPDPNADPDDPGAYRFGPTDTLTDHMAERGIGLLFRLGNSWGQDPAPRMSDEKWADVALHIVRHYNEGWANGRRLGIRYWEIWNEPNGPIFWKGSPESFYRLYAVTAKALKAYDPSLKVGGPGLAGWTSTAWVKDFLAYLKANEAPLDFFSWHLYHLGSAHTVATAQRAVRRLVDAGGFPQAEVFNDEWNISAGNCRSNPGCPALFPSAYNAAHAVAAMTYWQDTDIPIAYRYRTDGFDVFGLFGDGRRFPPYARAGLAYRLFAGFADAPERLATTGGDDGGYTVLAGRSVTGAVQVLVADQGSGAAGYDLRLVGFPAQLDWRVEEISDDPPCDLANGCDVAVVAEGNEADLGPDRVLSVPMRSPAVHRILITPRGGGVATVTPTGTPAPTVTPQPPATPTAGGTATVTSSPPATPSPTTAAPPPLVRLHLPIARRDASARR